MKRTAKVRILAWLMIVCLIVPDLSLDAFSAELSSMNDSDSYAEEISDEEVDPMAGIVYDEDLRLENVEVIPDVNTAIIRGKVCGHSKNPKVSVLVDGSPVKEVICTRADYSQTKGVYYEYDSEFSYAMMYLKEKTQREISIGLNNDKSSSYKLNTLGKEDVSLNAKLDNITNIPNQKTSLLYEITGTGYSQTDTYYYVYYKCLSDKDGKSVENEDWNVWKQSSVGYSIQDKDVLAGKIFISAFLYGLEDGYTYQFNLASFDEHISNITPDDDEYKKNVQFEDIQKIKLEGQDTKNKLSFYDDSESISCTSYSADVFAAMNTSDNVSAYKYDEDNKQYVKISDAKNLKIKVYSLEPGKDYKIAVVLSGNALPETFNDEKLLQDSCGAVIYKSFTTHVDDRTVEFSQSKEEVDYSTYKAMFAVKGSYDAVTELAPLYYVYKYKSANGEWVEYSEHDLQTTCNIHLDGLSEGTEYEYSMIVKKNIADPDEKAVYKNTGKFSTIKNDNVIEIIKGEDYEDVAAHTYKYSFRVNGKAANEGQGLDYAVFYKKSSEKDFANAESGVAESLGKINTRVLSGLKPSTKYDLKIVLLKKSYENSVDKDGNIIKENIQDEKTVTFQTVADDRKITVTKIEPRSDKATISFKVDGTVASKESRNVCCLLYRAKGTEQYSVETTTILGKVTNGNITVNNLKAKTEYEYVLLLLNDDFRDDLIDLKTGKLVSADLLNEAQKAAAEGYIVSSCSNTFKTTEEDRYIEFYDEVIGVNKYITGVRLVGPQGSEKLQKNSIFAMNIKPASEKKYSSYDMRTGDGFAWYGLTANTEYDYTVWYLANYETDENGNFKNVILSRSGKFKTLEDDRVAYITNAEIGAESYSAEIGISGKASMVPGTTYIYYFCKKAADSDYTLCDILTSECINDKGKIVRKNPYINMSGLDEDTEFNYKILLSDTYNSSFTLDESDIVGKKLEGKFKTIKDDRKPILVEESEKIGRTEYHAEFDIQGKNAEFNKHDTVICYYYKKAGDKEWINKEPIIAKWGWEEGSPVYAEINLFGLKPGTAYEYKAGVAKDAVWGDASTYPQKESDITKDNSITGTFTTVADERTLVMVEDSVEARLNSVKARFFVQGVNEEVDFKDIFGNEIENPSCKLALRYKKEADKEWTYIDKEYLYNDPVNSGTVNFVGLAENTEYTVEGAITSSDAVAENGVYDVEYKALGKFSTIADDRAVILANSELTPYVFNGTFELTGKAAIEKTYWLFMWQDLNGDWHIERNITNDNAENQFSSVFTIAEMETGKTYNYKLAVGKKEISPDAILAEKLNDAHRMKDNTYVLEGSVVAPAETRTIGDVSILTGFNTAKMTASVNNNVLGLNTTLYLYYREKDTYVWKQMSLSGYTSDFTRIFDITNLEAGKEYEYVLAIFKDTNRKFDPDNKEFSEVIAASKSGSFKTDAVDYSIEFALKEDGATYNSLDINGTLKSESNNDSLIEVTAYLLDKNDTNINNAIKVKSKLSPYYQDFTNNFLFENLEANTTYKIVQADLSAYENGKAYKLTTLEDLNFEFTTLQATVSSIKLETEYSKLNIGEDGFDKTTVNVVVPEGEASDVYFTVSGNQMGIVSVTDIESDSITVKGLKPGDVKVMAVSKYNNKIKAEITISVADVKLFYIDAEGNEEQVDSKVLIYNIYPDVVQAYKLYSYVDGNRKEVFPTENATFTKEGIAAGGEVGKSIEITGVKTGYTDVVFSYNGYLTGFVAGVKSKAVAFAVAKLDNHDNSTNAIETKDGYIVAKTSSSTPYDVVLVATPDKDSIALDNRDFNWKSSNDKVIKVSKDGKLTVVSADPDEDVVITITPKDETISPVQINVKALELPNTPGTSTVYSNLKVKTLKDVKFNTSVSGWEWIDPKTSVESLVAGESYSFEAMYTGTSYYPYKTNVYVKYGVITGLEVTDGGHNHILEISADGHDDELNLYYTINGIHKNDSDFELVVYSKGDLAIRHNSGSLSATVSAAKAGTYTVVADLYHKDTNKKVASSKYKLTVVKDSVASRVVIEGYQDNTLVAMVDDANNVNEKLICLMDAKKNFKLVAKAYDYKGDLIENAKFKWSVTDKKVASVKANKDGTDVNAVGEGNAFVNVKVSDKRGIIEEIAIQVRNYNPKFSSENAKINLAYDYSQASGRSLAAENGGLVDIIPASAYGDAITSIAVYEDDTCTTLSKDIAVIQYSENKYNFANGHYLVVPKYIAADGTNNEIAEGEKDIYVKVSTKLNSGDAVQAKKVHVSVKTELPKIKAKNSKKMNLFYKEDLGTVKFVAKNLPSSISKVEWDDGHSTVSANMTEADLINNNSFYMAYDNTEGVAYIYQNYIKTKLSGKKIVPDGTSLTGTINVYLDGYRLPAKIEKFKVSYMYKAAKLQVKYWNNFKSICTDLDMNVNYFSLFDKTRKALLYYDYNNDGKWLDSGCTINSFQQIDNSNKNLKFIDEDITQDTEYVSCEMVESKKSEKTNLNIISMGWRNTAGVKYTLKNVKPKATLQKSKLVFNTKYSESYSDDIIIKNVGYCATVCDAKVQPQGKSSKVLSQNAIEIFVNNNDTLEISKNHKADNFEVPTGKFSFSITPVVKVKSNNAPDASANDAGSDDTYTTKELNKLKLSITITDKLPTLSAKIQGKIDICKLNNYYNNYSASDPSTYSDCRMSEPSIKNMYDGADVDSSTFRLAGQYSSYFRMVQNNRERGYLIFLNDYGKVKARFNYKLRLTEKIIFNSGEEIQLESKPLSIKTTQKNPKIKVKGTAELYSTSNSYTAVVDIEGPKGYALWNAYGTTNVVKDSYDDFWYMCNYNEHTGKGTISITLINYDGVVANKSYKVPVTLQFVGTDGVVKPMTLKVKTVLHR